MRMSSRLRRKYSHQAAVPVNVTLPPLLHTKLYEVITRLGFSGPSDYFQARIRADAGLQLAKHEQQAPRQPDAQ